MAEQKYILSPRSPNPVTLFSTELSSLADGSAAISPVVENTTSLDLFCEIELIVTFPIAPTSGLLIEAFIVRSFDGTNYEDATSGASPVLASKYAGAFSVRSVTTQQRIHLPERVVIPPRGFRVQLRNSSGQTLGPSGNTARAFFYRYQTV